MFKLTFIFFSYIILKIMNSEQHPIPASDLFSSNTSTNEDGNDLSSGTKKNNQEIGDSIQNVTNFFDNLSIKPEENNNKVVLESTLNKDEGILGNNVDLLKTNTEVNSSTYNEKSISKVFDINKCQSLENEKIKKEYNATSTESNVLNSAQKELKNTNLSSSNIFSGPIVASALFEASDQSPFDNLVGISADDKDLFTSALNNSEAERRQQAWIPPKNIRNILDNISDVKNKTSLKIQFSKPKLLNSQTINKPINQQLQKYGILSNITSKNIPDDVSGDLEGLKKLVSGGNLYAAIDLTTKVILKLTNENVNQSITINILNWYNARFNLMFRLKLYSTLQSELELFNDFNTADFYYEFYPTVYPAKRGCMVPFTMRLLHALLPVTVNTLNCAQTLSRLYQLKIVAETILHNLDSNKCEEGVKVQLNDIDKRESINLWSKRLVMILQAIANTLLIIKEYGSSFEMFDKIVLLLEKSYLPPEVKVLSIVNVHSCIGRSLLQLGDIKQAQQRFVLAEKASCNSNLIAVQTVLVMNKGFLYLGANNWKESLVNFNKAISIDSTNIEAHNNTAVCLLYMCKLKDAIKTLEEAVYENKPLINSLRTYSKPKQQSFEGLCANLVTSYELESSKHQVKRSKLLQHVAAICGDCFSITALKL